MIRCLNLGRISYRKAWELQQRLREERANGGIDDLFLLGEHDPVFTIGRQDCSEDWLASSETIRQAGIDVVQINRGGRITYHGPGQIVGYFIFDITARQIGVRELVTKVEDLLIRTVATWGVTAARDEVNPGIWVGRDKLGAIGLHISRGITQHGFALNHAPRLQDYQYIVPCGIRDRGVTTLDRLLGTASPSRDEVCASLVEQVGQVFQDELESSAGTASKVGLPSPDFAAEVSRVSSSPGSS